MMRYPWLALALSLLGCGDEPLTTTREHCGYGERTFQVDIAKSRLDAVIIVEPRLGLELAPKLSLLIDALATGNIDDDPARDLAREDTVRLSLISPDAAARHLRDPEGEPLPFVRHRNAPHGFADDVSSFTSRALCMFEREPQACAADPVEGEPPFARDYTIVFVVSDDSGEERADLLEALSDNDRWDVFVIANEDYRQVFASYPYLNGGSSPALVDEGVQRNDDGTYACDLDEVLPADGPITHCAQLAPFGRAAEPVSIEDGREVCRFEQVTDLPALLRDTEWSGGSTVRLRCTMEQSELPSCER